MDIELIEQDLEKIIEWWIDEFRPPFSTEAERKFSETSLKNYLSRKTERYGTFDISIKFDKDGTISVDCTPMVNLKRDYLRRVK